MIRLVRTDEAARLGARLVAAWPSSGASPTTAAIFAERMVGWEYAPACVAVERLIDSSRWLPTVVDLRDAYGAAGGPLADPGRNMSPEVGELPPLPTEAQRAEIAGLRAELHAALAERRVVDEGAPSGYRRASDDVERSRG